MPKTKVDAVELKRQGALAVVAQLAAMSPEQQQRFWEAQTQALRERQQAIRTAGAKHQGVRTPTK